MFGMFVTHKKVLYKNKLNINYNQKFFATRLNVHQSNYLIFIYA